MKKMIELGDRVKDPVTGISGIAYVRLSYLQGCDRIGIQPPLIKAKDKEPIVPDLFHVDEPQLKITKKHAIDVQAKKADDNGGPSFFAPRDR